MVNPPFNVDKVDKEKLSDNPRFPFGMPRRDNAKYLWILRSVSRRLRNQVDHPGGLMCVRAINPELKCPIAGQLVNGFESNTAHQRLH